MPNDKTSDSAGLIGQYYRDNVINTANTYNLPDFEKRVGESMHSPNLSLEPGASAQNNTIESINQTYFERIALVEQKAPLERDNARLFSIAIFLQVIGLILMLARDPRRS